MTPDVLDRISRRAAEELGLDYDACTDEQREAIRVGVACAQAFHIGVMQEAMWRILPAGPIRTNLSIGPDRQ